MISYEKPEITLLGEAALVVKGSVINPPDNQQHPEQGKNPGFELED